MKTPSWFLKRNFIAWLLLPVAVLYFFGSRLVFFYRRFYAKSSKRPVICIGNIFAGGVGKTPIVREVAKRLGAPVVMRGYKGGDEAKMLANAGLDVYIGNRIKSIGYINYCLLPPVPCLVMDDGFQNSAIKKDISILVFDEKIGVGNGFVLPAGPLREPLSAISRADALIIVTQNAKLATKNAIIETAKRYKKPVFYAKNKSSLPVSCLMSHVSFIAFAGIGYPQKFFENLPKRPVKTISFPDHYQYTDADLKSLFAMAKRENAKLITTEKDWVRLPIAAQKKIEFAPLETTIEPAFYKWLKGKLDECDKKIN